MLLIWFLAAILPVTMICGLALMNGVVSFAGLRPDRRADLGWKIIESASVLSLIAFLAGLNITMV